MAATIKRHPLLLLAAIGSLAGSEAEKTIALCGVESREFSVLDVLARTAGPTAQATSHITSIATEPPL
jgi:hypothetical protein